MTSQDARYAVEQYWAERSQYVPLLERRAYPEGIQKVSPHILFDPRIDLTSERVRESSIPIESIHHTLDRGFRDIPEDDKFAFRQKHVNQVPFDLPTAVGHPPNKAARLRGLKPFDCNQDLHGGFIWNQKYHE